MADPLVGVAICMVAVVLAGFAVWIDREYP
jgi:hypothetical protein